MISGNADSKQSILVKYEVSVKCSPGDTVFLSGKDKIDIEINYLKDSIDRMPKEM